MRTVGDVISGLSGGRMDQVMVFAFEFPSTVTLVSYRSVSNAAFKNSLRVGSLLGSRARAVEPQ